MTIPAWLLSVAIWLSIAGVAVGVIFFLIVLVREWREGSLW